MYKMKKLRNWILNSSDYYVGVIALICLYAILQIKFGFAFWIGSSTHSGDINEVITNLSYSYLAGYIFFFLTVTLPHWKMRSKVKTALQGKADTISTNYWACIESVIPLPNALERNKSKDEVLALFKAASSKQPCRLASIGIKVPVAEYIKAKHKENRQMATELLEYKQWLSSATIAQIEKIRNSNLSSIVISMTNPFLQDALDNEGSMGTLASEVYDLWVIAKNIEA